MSNYEPVAWMFKDDLENFKNGEVSAEAYSIEVMRHDREKCLPLYLHDWKPIESCPKFVKVFLWRRGTDPEIGFWPGILQNSDEVYPPTHWMPMFKGPE